MQILLAAAERPERWGKALGADGPLRMRNRVLRDAFRSRERASKLFRSLCPKGSAQAQDVRNLRTTVRGKAEENMLARVLQ
jgi:hypothetical protein